MNAQLPSKSLKDFLNLFKDFGWSVTSKTLRESLEKWRHSRTIKLLRAL